MASDIMVDLIAGFRGAGKTTLLLRMAEQLWQGQRVVLLINERGTSAPPQAVLPAGCTIVEWQSGCLCCSASALLAQSLSELTQNYQPDRIVVELAETARIADVKAAFEAMDLAFFQIEHIIYVLSAKSFVCKWELSAGFMSRQLKDSPVVWMTHTENSSQSLRSRITQVISENNPRCVIMDSDNEITELYRKSALHKRLVFHSTPAKPARTYSGFWKA